MIYVVVGLVLIVLILRRTAPKRYAVHAATAKRLPDGIQAEDRWNPGFIRDEKGAFIDVGGKFVGRAVRDSMADFGIPDGSTFIGDILTDEERLALVRGDIVVVKGAAAHSETGLRLRRVDLIGPDNTVQFIPDGYGNERRARPLGEVLAKVTHVITESDPRGFVARVLSNFVHWAHAA